jgi:hypothetical protein
MSPALAWWLYINVLARMWSPPKREKQEEA